MSILERLHQAKAVRGNLGADGSQSYPIAGNYNLVGSLRRMEAESFAGALAQITGCGDAGGRRRILHFYLAALGITLADDNRPGGGEARRYHGGDIVVDIVTVSEAGGTCRLRLTAITLDSALQSEPIVLDCPAADAEMLEPMVATAVMAALKVRPNKTKSLLSAREKACLSLLAEGTRVAGIAEALGLAAVTVELYLRNARTKLKARTLPGAVAQALARGEI